MSWLVTEVVNFKLVSMNYPSYTSYLVDIFPFLTNLDQMADMKFNCSSTLYMISHSSGESNLRSAPLLRVIQTR